MPAIQNTPVIEGPMVNKWVSHTNRRDVSGRPFYFSETNHNNNYKQPFSLSFETRYLTKVSGVSLLAYGTLFNQRKAPLTGEMSERLVSINGETSHQLGGRKLVLIV